MIDGPKPNVESLAIPEWETKPRRFHCRFRYQDRPSKAAYVWQKYQSILAGAKILDVGADECHLKEYLDAQASYWGVGLGGHPDQQLDLERGQLPFDDRSFDVVLCLDVLEHIESIHPIFDELCRVSRKYVVIALPNPWESFWRMLRKGSHEPGRPMKFYGLPLDPPSDRHRWFFGADDAQHFICKRAAGCGFNVVQIDFGADDDDATSWITRLKRRFQTWGIRYEVNRANLYASSIWAVIERTHG